jgi:hypothetical protein
MGQDKDKVTANAKLGVYKYFDFSTGACVIFKIISKQSNGHFCCKVLEYTGHYTYDKNQIYTWWFPDFSPYTYFSVYGTPLYNAILGTESPSKDTGEDDV